MNVETMEYKKAAGQKDHFRRLPEELLLSIFSRVANLKSLCQCSLVSKRFASVISHIQTISVTFPSSGAHSIESYKRMCALFREIHLVSSEQIPEFLELLSLQKLKLPAFLDKFRNLESINVEYTFPRNIGNSSFLKWKVKCKSSSAMIENFVALLPASVHKKNVYEFDQEGASQESTSEFIKSQINDCFWLSFGRYTEWLCLVCMLIKCHASLQSVTIKDSEKQGKLVIRDEQLVKVRSCLLEKQREDDKIQSILKIAWVPELHLPLSGHFMRGVCLVIIKVPSESHTSAKDDGENDILAWDFEDEEKVLGEAINEILKNHRDKIEIAE